MQTSVQTIGVGKINVAQSVVNHANAPQTLGEKVRKIANDRYKEIVEGVKGHLISEITKSAVERKYSFNMRKFVGSKYHTECTISMHADVKRWLNSEDFIVSLPSLDPRDQPDFYLNISW